ATATSNEAGPVSSSVDTPINYAPGISIAKSVTSVTDTNHAGLTDPGDVIHYNIHVANTGDVTLTGLTVTDPLTGNPVRAVTLAVGVFEDLAAIYTITQSDVDTHGATTSTPFPYTTLFRSATATSNEAGPVSSSVDTPINYAPGISIAKSVTS